MMIVVDFTHLIEEDMSVFMETEGPSLTEANTYSEDGFKETKLSFFSHTGTHMDAPLHIFEQGCALDEMPAEQFVGAALIVDCSHLTSGQQIGLKEIDAKRKLADEADFLLFYTGWSRYWGSREHICGLPLKYIHADGAPIRAIGMFSKEDEVE